MPKAPAPAFVWDPKAPAIFFDPNDPNSRSVTNQSDKDSTDLNVILARYEKTGLIYGQNRPPMFDDFTVLPNFYEMQNRIAKVNQSFDLLPASMRNRFGNDPQKLIDFLLDDKNTAEAVTLGLKNAPDSVASPAPAPVEKPDPTAPPVLPPGGGK